jgi:hypothetical protein
MKTKMIYILIIGFLSIVKMGFASDKIIDTEKNSKASASGNASKNNNEDSKKAKRQEMLEQLARELKGSSHREPPPAYNNYERKMWNDSQGRPTLLEGKSW